MAPSQNPGDGEGFPAAPAARSVCAFLNATSAGLWPSRLRHPAPDAEILSRRPLYSAAFCHAEMRPAAALSVRQEVRGRPNGPPFANRPPEASRRRIFGMWCSGLT